ncbi:MAG: LPXTG cell wall anchor domain-containing protein [Phycisphaerales bacterium]|nr:LPXTG cell wall anchor domain-containing protein [Phycisphaerales bacterium]
MRQKTRMSTGISVALLAILGVFILLAVAGWFFSR